MRRYTISVGEQAYVIDVEEESADTYRVRLEGRTHHVRVDDHRDLAQAAITPELEVGQVSEAAAVVPTAPSSESSAPAQRTRPARAAVGGGGEGTLSAPMPGVVISVETQVGTVVAQHDPLLVLEAMKMKNTLRAGRDGRVAEILVGVGDQVKYGDALVRIEDA